MSKNQSENNFYASLTSILWDATRLGDKAVKASKCHGDEAQFVNSGLLKNLLSQAADPEYQFINCGNRFNDLAEALDESRMTNKDALELTQEIHEKAKAKLSKFTNH